MENAEKVVCVELDEGLFPILNETLAGYDNLTLVHGDILKIDLHSLIKENFEGMDVAVCANLPYYITSPVIMRLLEEELPIKKIIVMVQKEAGDRLTAKVGSRAAGAVTARSRGGLQGVSLRRSRARRPRRRARRFRRYSRGQSSPL